MRIFLCFLLVIACCYATFVPTPFGIRPKQCVHRVESDVFLKPVEGGVEVHHPNGTIVFLPAIQECIEWDQKMQVLRAARRNSTTPIRLPGDGWLDNAGYYPPGYVSTFVGNYQVPGSPPSDGSQVLFYFIGTENFQTGVGVSILQPVLTWGNGINGWSIASWNCCPSGQTHESTPLTGFGPGDGLTGYIDKSGSSWSVTSVYGGQQTKLNVPSSGRVFDWTDVTLETYSVTSCNQFATGPMTFSAMKMSLTSGDRPTPQWNPTGATECGGRLSVLSPSTITITHN